MPTNSAPPTPPPFPPERKPWRFSMRTMMLGMTGFAIFCAFISALPYEINQVIIGSIWLAAAGWLFTGLIFARGDQRAFCIGATVVLSSMWTRIGGQFMQGMTGVARIFFLDAQLSRALGAWLNLVLLAAVAALNGYLCIRARRYFERHNRQDP